MTPTDPKLKKKYQQAWLDELRHWPYTIHQIDDTLDSILIEGRGKQLLFQALNSASVTAFVGTGISAAYGRMGWSEWRTEQLRRVEDLSARFLELAEIETEFLDDILEHYKNDKIAEQNHKRAIDVRHGCRWLEHRLQVLQRAVWDVSNLANTFHAGKSERGSFPGGEDIPVLFEIAKKLHYLLRQHSTMFSGLDSPIDAGAWSADAGDQEQDLAFAALKDHRKSLASHFERTRYATIAMKHDWHEEAKYLFGVTAQESQGAPIPNLAGLFAWAQSKNLIGSPEHTETYRKVVDALASLNVLFLDKTADYSFDDLAKSLLIDECPHAVKLLKDGLSVAEEEDGREFNDQEFTTQHVAKILSDAAPDQQDNLKRDIDGIRDNPERYTVLEHFGLERTIKLIAFALGEGQDKEVFVPAIWCQALRNIKERLEEYSAKQPKAALQTERVYLTPTSRFLVPMLLRLVADPAEFLRLQGADEVKAPAPDSFKSRRSIIARRFDPLERISEGLGIRRFLTTNYDFEIERFYQDKGYSRFDPHRSFPAEERAADDPLQFRTNGMGGEMRDMTFQSATATDLLAFAASRSDVDVSVFHLHGRATKADRIVATERDYMDLYLREDPDREVVDESILMAFAASPILFLGLGMNEADVLRPLRQFMSDQDRAVGYRAIVLLPADRDFDSRTKLAAGLYLRYGAHTIFFGSGYMGEQEKLEGRRPLDWLHRVTNVIKALQKAVDDRIKILAGEPDVTDTRQILLSPAALNDAVGELGNDLLEPEDRVQQKLDPDTDKIVNRALYRLFTTSNGTTRIPLGPDHYVVADNAHNTAWQANQQSVDELTATVRDWRIENCSFTTHRHQNVEASRPERAVEVDGEVFTQFYINRLNEILQIAMTPQHYAQKKEEQRSLQAMLVALSGLSGAIQTACLNASLESLKLEWEAWWKDWQTPPPLREARFQQLDLAAEEANHPIAMPRQEVRHRVEGVITDLRVHANKRAPAIAIKNVDHEKQVVFEPEFQTGVRIFDRFIYDVHRIAEVRSSSEGRFVTTVAAERGFGKGVFFSTLSSSLGVTSYIRAAHRDISKKHAVIYRRFWNARHVQQPGQPVFISAIYINFSFATELASAYDMLSDSLLRTVAQLQVLTNRDPSKQDNIRSQEQHNEDFQPAIDAAKAKGNNDLRFLEQYFSLDGDEHRILPTIEECKDEKGQNPFKVLNGRIGTAVRALEKGSLSKLSRFERTKRLMKDINSLSKKLPETGWHFRPRVLICMNALELLFDSGKKPKNREISDYLSFFSGRKCANLPFDFIFVGAMKGMGHFFENDARLERRTFAWDELRVDTESELRDRAEIYGVPCPASGRLSADQVARPVNYVHLARRADPQRVLVDNFALLAIALHTARRMRTQLKDAGDINDRLSKTVRTAYEGLIQNRDEMWLERTPPDCNAGYLSAREDFKNKISDEFRLTLSKEEQESLPSATDKPLGFADRLFHLFRPDDDTQDFLDWQNLTKVLEGNRFCLTILLAAAEQLVLSEADFVDGGDLANRFLETTVSVLRNASTGRREEVVLNEVMSVYRRLSRIGDVDYDHRFHQLLLRNIAVLGCPVSPNILVRLPDIREYFNRVRFDSDVSRRRMVARALAALAERGLLFRISPHPKLIRLDERIGSSEHRQKAADNDPDAKEWARVRTSLDSWPSKHEYRYAQHRQIQSYCFQRLGNLTAQPVTANSFAPTLYAAMPSRVVRLSTEGYLFLRRLLLGLSQYPDIRHEDAARAMPIFADDDIITKVQALRAALSLARTCFSIAAVSRFDNKMTGLGFIRKRGHFETYRVRLRWILRKAWEVHEPRQTRSDATVDEYRVNALYQDEVVWLYNEVAVTCLVQGNLTGAIGHARQAIYLNRRIEGAGQSGRTHNMLSLNLAIIQFERGRLQAAESRLNDIVASEGNANTPLSTLAKGYLALIAQLQGRSDEAEKLLETVIGHLEKGNEDRALAIMLHHKARLVAAYDVGTAEHLTRRARDYAEKGGHEDVRHRILVSEVWISQGFTKDPQNRMEADRIKLREAERYSETMGLESLLVESLHAQGKMLFSAGDYSRSGRLLTKAMAIARRNDMGLRLNAAMTSYARILLARRRVGSAKRLLYAALTLAKRNGYAIEVRRIHAVLDDAERQTTAADTPVKRSAP